MVSGTFLIDDEVLRSTEAPSFAHGDACGALDAQAQPLNYVDQRGSR